MATISVDNLWHERSPKIEATGSIDFTLNDSDNKVYFSGTITDTITNAAQGGWYGTGYEDVFYIQVNDDIIGYWTGKPSDRSTASDWPDSWSIDIDGSFSNTGDQEVGLYVSCYYSGGDCPQHFDDIFLGSFNTSELYSRPSYSIVSISPQIGIYNSQTFTTTYKVSGGSNNLRWKKFRLINSNSTAVLAEQNLNTNKSDSNQTTTFVLSSLYANASSAQHYRGDIQFYDDHATYETGDLDFYTYTLPIMDNSITTSRSTQNATQDNKFVISGINNRTFTSLENEFQTRYRYKIGSGSYNNWDSLGNITTWNPNATTIRSLVPYSSTNDGATITLQMQRYSPSSGQASSNQPTTTFVVYYRPRNGISNSSFRINNASGAAVTGNSIVINDSTLTGIYVSWTYDTTVANAGYTEGYRIRLYNSAGTVVKTYYTTNKYYTIPKADIPKCQITQIDITPYYKNGQSSAANYVYYNGTITKMNFVRLYSKLNAPTIVYPVVDSNWFNTDYRICVTLPTDPDKNYISGTYEYNEIKVVVGSQTLLYTTNDAPFSNNNLAVYNNNIVIYPGAILSNLSTGTITIKVSVQKKYGLTGTDSWSSEVTRTFKVNTYTSPTLVAGTTKILATHYNNATNLLYRACNTYGVSYTQATVSAGTVIQRSQFNYNVMYKYINDVKTKVNTFATFGTGKTGLKFDSNNTIPTTFTPTEEYVTALANGTGGRNYMRLLEDYLQLLV